MEAFFSLSNIWYLYFNVSHSSDENEIWSDVYCVLAVDSKMPNHIFQHLYEHHVCDELIMHAVDLLG